MVSPESPASMSRQLRLDTTDGVTLALEQFGEAPAPAVVFAHGFGQTRDAWASCAGAAAQQGWVAFSYDARGHGQSSWLEDGHYSVDQLVSDLGQVTRHVPSLPVVVGASMGGLIGIAMAGADASSCRALVLVDVTPRWEPAGVERILDFMRAHPGGFADYNEAADVIAAYLPHRKSRKSPQSLRRLLVETDSGRLHWHWDPNMLAPIAEDGQRHQADLLQAATNIRVPTLLISGSASDVVSESTINEFLELVPHARHVMVPHATHMVAGDENSQFTKHVLDFLDSLPPD
ncbi:alpha/beta fold hydrolase [Dokdonella sp.]|uniref:alpha/beta fold hydrolase n=1 Tax=Dokdonella sp. TaxID=2291710 RepID=UPI003C5DCE03